MESPGVINAYRETQPYTDAICRWCRTCSYSSMLGAANRIADRISENLQPK